MLFGSLAFAGPDKDKCTQSAEKHKNSCQQAVNGVNAADAARSGATGAAAGVNVNQNSGSLGNDIASQRANIQKAKQQCEQDKKQCEKDCDQAKQSAQQGAQRKISQRQTPEPEQSDASAIPGEKQSKCTAPIAAMIGQLDSADSNLAKDSDAAKNTKDQSQNGGMPQMPQMPQKQGDDKNQDTPQTAEAGSGLKCDAGGTERFSDCNETYVKKCSVDMNAAGCNAFADRYCNLKDSSGTVQSPMMKSALPTNLVVDKTGEGLGQPFCGIVNAYRFCQVKGREACPSCLKLNGADSTSSDALARAAGECPSDPAFLASAGSSAATVVTGGNPPSSGNTGSGTDRIVGGVTGGGGGGMGSGGGSGAITSGNGGQSSGVYTPESVRRLAGGSAGGGGGADGGGGGGSMPWTPPTEDEEKKDEAAAGVDPAGSGIPPLYQPARDVAAKASPSLFMLGSRAYTSYCTRSQIKSCK